MNVIIEIVVGTRSLVEASVYITSFEVKVSYRIARKPQRSDARGELNDAKDCVSEMVRNACGNQEQ